MFSKLIPAFVLTALAGRVLAQTPATNFTVSIGPHANIVIPANKVLDFDVSSFPVISSCAPSCTNASTAINSCFTNSINDTACYCTPALTGALQTCEECMFTALVRANKPAPTPLAGSNQVLGGWTANCVNATTPPALALTLPPGCLGWAFRLRFPYGHRMGYRRYRRRPGLVFDLHALPNVMRRCFKG
ncbi:hypothetical protein MSAN_00714100 [Mycena sanguinolenta]|uniref:Extracellular membrane protein CFEM domain-containing protein n=1 Tax=Mycena sanguinolenta TaxID=230812 RepID=A0A8H6Z6P1_9AGAR|nr:hypothetical protein MSAN_00714100 [Mycena sanguinolenta]